MVHNIIRMKSNKFVLFLLFIPSILFSQLEKKQSENNILIKGSFVTWQQGTYPIDSVPLDKLSQLDICFAFPEKNGGLNTSEIKNIKYIVEKCHAQNVKVGLCIGGANTGQNFPEFSKTDSTRRRFVQNTLDYAIENKIDHIDIDWEYWPTPEVVDQEVNRNIVLLFKELYKELSAKNITLGYDVFAGDWYGKHYPSELINYADEIVIMAFSNAGPWSEIGHHSPTFLVDESYNYWIGRIGEDNKHKVSVTLPFYGFKFDENHTAGNSETAASIGYNEILKEFPSAYEQDTLKTDQYIYIHNGTNTINQKIELFQKFEVKSVIIWEMSHDSGTGNKSLLNFLYKNLNEK
jgi:GH18 family chitinase